LGPLYPLHRLGEVASRQFEAVTVGVGVNHGCLRSFVTVFRND
jgi:hypothetical protein